MPKPAKLKNRKGKIRRQNVTTWGKGHSSDSNPTTKKFRNLATKSRFAHPLNVHAEIHAENDCCSNKIDKILNRDQKLLENLNINDENDESQSTLSSAETAETKFSHFTNCTNPTFNRVHRLWKSGSNMQNDVLSVLAAVTDVIKKGGGRETEVEYFGALVTSLGNDDQSTNTLAATAYLLSLVIKKISQSILVARFSQLSQIFYVRLVQSMNVGDDNNEFNALLRYLLVNLGVLLKAQPRQTWESSSTSSMLDGLLNFVVDHRPTLRKTAQTCVADIVNNVGSDNVAHPTAKICSKFCIDTLERCGGEGKNVNSTLYVLHFLQKCLHRFGSTSLKSTVETLLKLMTLSSPLVQSSTLQTLYSMFLQRPTDASMTDETNGQIILALYDFEPSENDLKSRLGWLRAVVEAHVCLVDKNAQICASSFFSKILQNCIDSLSATTQSDVVAFTIGSCKRLLTDCLKEFFKLNLVDEKISSKITSTLQNLLSYQFMSVWPRCFDIFSTYFDVLRSSPNVVDLRNLLQSMAELRESENFAYKSQLDKIFGSAIRHLGPEVVLNAVPLSIDADAPALSVDFPNSWLIPLLRQNVVASKLNHFATIFLPIAVRLKKRVEKFASAGKTIEANVFDVVQRQIWELLPSYCNAPTDVADSFKGIAKILGSVLLDRPSLRLTVLSSLRALILKNSSNDVSKQELARYAKNFLPILINLYVSETSPENADAVGYDDQGVRLAALETIRVYLKITPSDLIEKFLNVALEKLNNNDESVNVYDRRNIKHRIMDVLISFVKYLNAIQISTLFNQVSVYCSQGQVDQSLQKKAYRVFEEISQANTTSAAEFMKADGRSLTDLLVNDFKLVASATKASRLRCFTALLDDFQRQSFDDDNYMSLIKMILPDAVMCLKENNVKTRRSAAKLLIAVANSVSAKLKNVDEATQFVWSPLERFFDGDVQEVCSVLVAARLFTFEFKNDVSSTMMSTFLSHVCRLMIDDRRPIVQSCLEFLKTFVSCASPITVGQYLEIFLPSLLSQNADCRRHFRFLTRKILAKLVKKFSYEIINKFAKDENTKTQLRYVRKMLTRQEKRKNSEKSESKKYSLMADDASVITGLSRPETIADLLRDSDDDNDEMEPDYDKKDDDVRSRRSRMSSKSGVFIEENDDDDDGDILDLLDRKIASKIVTKDVLKKKNRPKRSQTSFKTDKDGRLIIVDDGDAVDEEQKKTTDEATDEMEKLLEPLGKRTRRDTNDDGQKKRRKRNYADDDDDDVDAALNYKPGGKGIHRPMAGVADNAGVKYKASKAKGDVKKKGQKNDPYAYIPLDHRELNKRKRAKSSGTYKNLIQGARKGATKGSKGRRKNKKT